MRLDLRPDEKNREDIKQACAKSAIEHGIIMHGDLPQDPKFWQSFKEDFLADNKHKPEEWERLTAHMPDELLGRKKDKDKNKDKTKDREQMRALSREGVNPHLSDNKPKKPANPVPTQTNINDLKRMKDSRTI